jgi:Xaa-Pro aminopeptidase
MVFTVEPGLYFRPEESGGEVTDFSGIGIRIEDDVLVTEEGCEVLTAALPTSSSDVEALVGRKS